MEFKDVYLTNTITDEGQSYYSGHVYSMPIEKADNLIREGNAELVSLSTLDDIKRQADEIAEAYTKQKKEIKESKRYDTNKSERKFLLDQLEQETAYKISQKEFEFKAEMEALKINAASLALEPQGTDEEIAAAETTADAINTQFLISQNTSAIFDLLELKVKTMSNVEKIALLKRFEDIERFAGNDPGNKRKIQAIESELRKVDNEHLRTLRHISALEASGASPSLKYRTLKTAGSRVYEF